MSFRDRLGLTVPQALLAWMLVVLIGGVAGLIAMLICNYLLSFAASHPSNKHGILNAQATRLGGVGILIYMVLHLGYQAYSGFYEPLLEEAAIMLISVTFFLIGVYEDLSGSLSARIRILLMLFAGLMTMWFVPTLVLQPVGIFWVDLLIGSGPLSAGLFTALCLAFIPNAFNTADGANGLVAGISAFTLAALVTVAPLHIVPFLLAALVACLVFLVFNLVSGRFLLGDGGAYFLGALVGLSIVSISNASGVSVWWLLSLVFYPIADLMWSMGRRILTGESPMNADNHHFHNALFNYIDTGDRPSTLSNTATGVSIATTFSGIPLVLTLLQVWPLMSDAWLLLVVSQWCLYGIGCKILRSGCV